MPLMPSASTPPMPRLTRVVSPVARSKTKTSSVPFVSSGTSVVASEAKAKWKPSAETAGQSLSPSPSTYSVLVLTRTVTGSSASTGEAAMASARRGGGDRHRGAPGDVIGGRADQAVGHG